MPTLTWLDSFEHQQPDASYYGTNAGVYDSRLNAGAMSFVTGRRTGSHALQMVQDGVTATRVGKVPAAGNRVLVESFYFKISAKPASSSFMWVGVAGVSAGLEVNSSTGTVSAFVGSGGTRQNNGVDYCDGQWHRCDLKYVTSANPYTLDLQIDGSAATQATGASAAADINNGHLGSTNTAHVLTCVYADWVRSLTSGDYPIGAHYCVALMPNADGTHNWASTNMGDNSGGRSSSVTDLNTKVNTWPASLVTTYIAYTNTTATSTEYAEILLPDVPSAATIWAARAIAALFSSGTSANAATTRIVDGSGTTVLDLYVGDQSDTAALRHQASLLSGVDTPSEVNALKFRVGFPTDSNPAPRWAGLMVDIALPGDNGDGAATPSTVAGVGAVPAPTAKGDGVATPGAVAGVGAVPAPTADGGSAPATASPGVVAGVGAVPAPTGRVDVTASPAATAGIGAVPAPTAFGAATALPAAVAGVGTVPAPTAAGTATATPGAVAGIGSVPAPTGRVDVAASPAATAGVGAVPAPTASGTAVATPGATAGTGSVPAPSANGGAAGVAFPNVVPGVGNVPAPTPTATATASPGTVAGIGSVPAPSATGSSPATASPATVAGVGAVPAPTSSGLALTTPATVAGVGAVPAAAAHGNGTATPNATAGIGAVPDPDAHSVIPGIALPDEVAGVGDVPAPSAVVSSTARPLVVAGVATVPFPVGHGNATAFPQGSSGDPFTDEFTDEFGEDGSAPTMGVGAVPAPNATGQGEPQTQHDFDPGRNGARFGARGTSAGWTGSPKEPALAGRATPEGGG